MATIQSLNPYLRRVAEIESNLNPNARNPNSSAGGLFQFIDSTANEYGLDGMKRYDPAFAIPAAQRLTENNRNVLRQKLGREPTDGELYLAHQQGAGGASQLLSNPDARLIDVIGNKAATLNAGDPNMTAGAFANQWINKFGNDTLAGNSGEDDLEEWTTVQADDTSEEWETINTQETNPVERPESSKGIFERIGEDINQRGSQAKEIIDASRKDKQSLPREWLQLMAPVSGAVGDVVGEGITSIGRGIDTVAPGTTGAVKDALLSLPSAGGGTLGDALPGEIEQLSGQYNQWKEKNPQLARDVEGGLGLASLITPIKGKSAANIIGDVAAEPVKAATTGTKNLVKGALARNEGQLDDAAQKIAEKATNAYSRMRQIGADFTPNASQNITNNIESALIVDGPLNPKLHDKAIAALEDIKENGFDSLEKLDQWRQTLNDVAGNFNDKVNARKARLMIDAIDDSIDVLSPRDLSSGSKDAVDALLEGRKEWSRKVKFETMADVIKNADGDPNKLKRDLERLRLSKKVKGWTKEERAALKIASQQTTGEGILKLLGKFGFDLGSGRAIGNTALPVAGGLVSGTAIVPTVGTAARQAQKYVGRGKAENVLKLIEKGK